jgi:signal transduction histidine kinase
MAVTIWDYRLRPVWWRRTRNLLTLAALVVSIAWSSPAGGWTGPQLEILVIGLPVAAGGWLLWLFSEPESRPAWSGILACGVAGLVLAVSLPDTPAIALPACLFGHTAIVMTPQWSIRLAVLGSTVYVAGRLLLFPPTGWVLIGPASLAAGLVVGLARRQSIRLAEETALAREEQARAGALADRARLAREIHDVLAHALSALAVQLETADALLENGRTDQARASVARAGQLAREGMAETRRAIGTLRGDTLPLAEMLDGLAAGYRTDRGAPATVRIEGKPRELGADAALALYRTAQEAMTNVGKHAPGAAVTVDLRYQGDDVRLRVSNGAAPAGADRSLVHTGGGYGLSGLRERAELAGGRFSAAPTADGYQVEVSLPVAARGE